MEFDGFRVVVTGGASGIGAATAGLFIQRGAQVAVLDLNPAPAGGATLAIPCDVTDDTTVRQAVRHAAESMGGIDIVVNNAGIGAQGTVEDNDDGEWLQVIDVNLMGVVRTSRAAMPHLRGSRSPAIVNTCSIAAAAGLPERALYAATKGAVRALTLAMAADHITEGIRVNCVSPGTTDTPWIGRLLGKAAAPAEERAALEARQPHGRLVAAEEVAAAIAYLASPLSGSTTGTDLAVDGGMHGIRLRS